MNDKVKAKLDNFFSAYPLHSIDRSQIIIFANENPAGIFYLIEGYVRQYAVSVSGTEVVINVFKPPAFFPMNWAINRTPNKYFYQSVGRVKFRRAPADDVVELLKKNPDVAYDLLSRLYSGVDGILERMIYLMVGPASHRLAIEIVVGSKRFGQKEPDGSRVWKISQQEIANRTGLSRETVSRELHHLPFVKVIHGGLRVTSPAKLEKFLSDNS